MNYEEKPKISVKIKAETVHAPIFVNVSMVHR